MTITFYGAAEEVTGSCFLVRGSTVTILIDCGLFQGERFANEKNYEPLPFACGEIDYILVTHAHLDHTGRIPKLCLEGFKGNVFATKPTLELTQLLWEDAMEVMEIEYQETGQLPLYSQKETENAAKYFTGVEYGEKIFFPGKDYAVFHDAGHILGSAFLELFIDGKKIVFSGDVGNIHPPIIRETENLPQDVEFLVCESTYGNRFHEPEQERHDLLLSAVKETIARNGTLLIPAFAVERTQEILYEFDTLMNRRIIPAVPIYLDSPLAIKVTNIFRNYPNFYNQEDLLVQKSGDDLFNFPGLRLATTREQSKKIKHVPPPKIIIAGSGMMNGGRIIYHLENYLTDSKNTILIIGYQASGTLGKKILDGERWVPIFHKSVKVNAHVHAIGAYSAHADQKKLLSWIENAKNLKNMALVHGDLEGMQGLAAKIQTQTKIKVHIPKYQQTLEI